MSSSTESPQRRPYTGSCHCGQTRYIAFLTLPHTAHPPQGSEIKGQLFYRCNCTLCHKAGLLHARLQDPANDFLLLSPLTPPTSKDAAQSVESSLQAYRCATGHVGWFFCRTCGCRCFGFFGENEVASVDLGALGVSEEARERVKAEVDAQGQTKIWKPKAHSKEYQYLSVNAHSLDARQQGLSLVDLVDSEHMIYVQYLDDDSRTWRYKKPYEGGTY